MSGCSVAVLDAFGPTAAEACPWRFDFTLLFEEAILTLPPLGIAVVWALLRFLALRRQAAKVKSSWLLAMKMGLFSTYVALHICLLVSWLAQGIPKTRVTTACIALTIAGYAALSVLSYLEHVRSVRPSTLLCVYLGTSILLDLARVRTLFFIHDGQTVAGIFLAGFCVKILLFTVEVSEKRRLLRPEWKGVSPEATSGVLNRALFIWLNDVFRRGFRTLLTVDILTPLDADLLAASEPLALEERWQRASKSSKYSLFWIFLVHYKWDFLAGVLPRLAYTGFSFTQPFLVERVLDFTDEPDDPNSNNVAYGLVAAYAIVYIGLSLSYAVYQHKTYRLITLFRGSLITLIFGKTLRVDSPVGADAEAITLMSADIDRIGSSMPLIHEVYASVVETALSLWLLYRLLKVAIVAPVIWIIVCLVIGLPLATAAGNAQTPWLEAIEERLAVTAKALGSMKAIKMTGLADIVSSKVANLRISEIRASRRHRVLNILVFVTYFASSALAPIWGFGAYILLARANDSGTLTEGVAFAALSLFELLNQPLICLIDGVEHIQTVMNSFYRVQEYLESKEREDYRITPTIKPPPSNSSLSSRLQDSNDMPLKEFPTADWTNSNIAATAKDASAWYTAEGGAVIQNLNFEIQHGQATMIFGPVGSGKSTLLKLLLGEMPFTSGSVATNFSRAAYCPQSPWTLWGTVQQNIVGMSPWDKPWYDTVVRACALSRDFEELANGDQTHIGTRGSRLSGGQQIRVSFARAIYSRSPIIILDDVLTGLDRATERSIIDAVFGPDGLLRQMKSTVILATSSANHLRFADSIIFLNEKGQITQQGTLESFSAAGGDVQKLASNPLTISTRPETEFLGEDLPELDILEHPGPEASRNAGDMRIYAYYARIAGWWTISIYLLACASFVVGVTFPSVWLQWWANANADHPNERIGYWLGVYGALAAVTMLGCTLADCVFNLQVLPKTSREFHELLLNTTMRASTSFLTSTDAGTTVNRFSQDLELIDNDLPMAVDQTVFQFMSVIVSAVLVFIGSGYVAAAIPFCIIALVFIQFFYLHTSRQLRLLDIEAKAPLFSHFLETLNGILCIRAYGWSHDYIQRNHQALNLSQKPYYLLWCIQRWLTLVLDLFNAGVAILLVAIATNVRNGSTTGFLGVALFNIVTFSSTLQTLVTQWTQVETALGAISRIRSYVLNTKDENLAREVGGVPEDWPASGTIIFNDISASYESSTEPVLKEINLTIKAGEKVAICGRTGSGKSSLISALLRMLELESGTISIDDVDISTIPRQQVRKRLNTVPQDPFFLHGSVRENLDPLQIAADQRITDVLRALGIWDFFQSRGGLDGDVSEEMLSHGQRQLFCLARAVIKPGSILIMDEATSSVDAETDELMQRVLHNESHGRTVIAIAHKLQLVLDYDRVILLDTGRIVESGSPQELLATPTSAFRALYESALRGSPQ